MYLCSSEYAGVWSPISQVRDTATSPVKTQADLPPITVTAHRNGQPVGQRILRHRGITAEYEMTLVNGNEYTIELGTPLPCFQQTLYWGHFRERYVLRYVNAAPGKRVAGALRVASVAALANATRTADFHDGSVLHVVVVLGMPRDMPGYTLAPIGTGHISICD